MVVVISENEIVLENHATVPTNDAGDANEGNDDAKDAASDKTEPIDPSHILDGVIAFVEVRSGHENRTKVVQSELISLGATISLRLNSKVFMQET